MDADQSAEHPQYQLTNLQQRQQYGLADWLGWLSSRVRRQRKSPQTIERSFFGGILHGWTL